MGPKPLFYDVNQHSLFHLQGLHSAWPQQQGMLALNTVVNLVVAGVGWSTKIGTCVDPKYCHSTCPAVNRTGPFTSLQPQLVRVARKDHSVWFAFEV